MSIRIKVVLLGDSGVGKTSIAQRFALNKFNPNNISSHGAGFISRLLEIPELQTSVTFRIWDTAGQERYQSMASLYYQDAAAALLVYDVTNKKSFEGVKRWVKQLKEKGREDVLIVLLGNKMDLVGEEEVDMLEVQEFADEIKAKVVAVSAKGNINIESAFSNIAIDLYKRETLISDEVTNNDLIDSTKTTTKSPRKNSVKISKIREIKKKTRNKCC